MSQQSDSNAKQPLHPPEDEAEGIGVARVAAYGRLTESWQNKVYEHALVLQFSSSDALMQAALAARWCEIELDSRISTLKQPSSDFETGIWPYLSTGTLEIRTDKPSSRAMALVLALFSRLRRYRTTQHQYKNALLVHFESEASLFKAIRDGLIFLDSVSKSKRAEIEALKRRHLQLLEASDLYHREFMIQVSSTKFDGGILGQPSWAKDFYYFGRLPFHATQHRKALDRLVCMAAGRSQPFADSRLNDVYSALVGLRRLDIGNLGIHLVAWMMEAQGTLTRFGGIHALALLLKENGVSGNDCGKDCFPSTEEYAGLRLCRAGPVPGILAPLLTTEDYVSVEEQVLLFSEMTRYDFGLIQGMGIDLR